MVTLAEALPGDASALRALMARVIGHSVTQEDALRADTIANVNANIEVWQVQRERCVHLKACEGNSIVGVVLVKDFWNLCSLFVAPEAQGRGIGRALLESASRGRLRHGAKVSLGIRRIAASHSMTFRRDSR